MYFISTKSAFCPATPIQKQAVRVAWAVRERLVHFYRHKKAGRSVKNAAAGLTYYWLSLGKNNCTLLSWG